jgi:hypothetical protein
MATGKLQHAVGIFLKRQDAEYALTEFRDAGFDMDKVSVIVRNADYDDQIGGAGVRDTKDEQVAGGTKAGATAGAATVSIIALVGSLGVLALPGVGAAAEVGILLANTLLGGAIDGPRGPLLGALLGWGVPGDRAIHFNERVSQRYDLIVVEGTAEDILRAEAILDRWRVTDWSIYDAP